MTLSERQQIFTKNVSKLITHIFFSGYACTFGEAYRTPEMAEIYASRGVGIKNSLHCKRLAIDLNLFFDGKYLPSSDSHALFGEYWESLHPANHWGGRFGDGNHYSMMDGTTDAM
jgi:hypothetical protein